MVEVSFVIPLIIMLVAGLILFAMFMVQMAQTKKAVITQAIEAAQEEKMQNQTMAQETIQVHLPIPGLSEYMATAYCFTSKATALVDRRKELKWMKE